MIREFRNRRRKVVVCGIIPRYDANAATRRKMSEINFRLWALCRQDDVQFFELWHHFNRDRSLYSRDGLHLNSVGKARLGRVLGECIGKIPRPQQIGSGSINGQNRNYAQDTDSEVEVVNLEDNNQDAPVHIENVRQEIEVDQVPVPVPELENSQGAVFQ